MMRKPARAPGACRPPVEGFPMIRQRTLIATALALLLAPARAQTLESVRQAVDDYFAEVTAATEARAALKRWGNEALPFLRELAGTPEDVGLVESLMPLRVGDWDLICAIREVDSPEAVELLIEILDGKTAQSAFQALDALDISTHRHADLLRSHLRFQQLVFRIAKTEDRSFATHWRGQAADIIAKLGWTDGEPLLELMLQSDDLRLRKTAAEALEKLTGRKVELVKPAVSFPAEVLAEALVPLDRLSNDDVRGRFEVWFDGRPTLILGSEDRLTPHDAGLDALGFESVPLAAQDILSLPVGPRRWRWIVLGSVPGEGWSSDPDFAMCIDSQREELWRYEPARAGIETACRLYGPDGCIGVAFGPGGDEGVVAFTADGQELFRVPRKHVTYELSSHPGLPDLWLHCGGDLTLHDNQGAPLASDSVALNPAAMAAGHFYASTAVLARGFDGRARVIGAGSGRSSEPCIRAFDAELQVLWSATVPDRLTALALLDPGDREPLCAATTEAGELFVFDLAGTLRQRLPLGDDGAHFKTGHGTPVYSISAGPLTDDGRYGLAVGLLGVTVVFELR